MNSATGHPLRAVPSPFPARACVPGEPVIPVRIVHGFTQTLPGRDRLFFQRVYFAPMPRPIQVGPGFSFPATLPVATIEAPRNQCIVLRSAAFKVFQHSGIAIDDFTEVDPSRTASYFGFDLKIGNRGMTDFNSNIVTDQFGQPGGGFAAGGPKAPVAIGTAGKASISPGAGQTHPFSGPITPNQPGEPFASYIRPGDQISARVIVLRPPNYDVRFFSVQMSGWLANETDLECMLNMLSG